MPETRRNGLLVGSPLSFKRRAQVIKAHVLTSVNDTAKDFKTPYGHTKTRSNSNSKGGVGVNGKKKEKEAEIESS